MRAATKNRTTQEQSGVSPISATLQPISGRPQPLKTAQAIRAQYGSELDDSDVRRIDYALRERAVCEKCPGYPCPNNGFKPVIRVDKKWGLSIAGKPCKIYAEHSRRIELERNFKHAKIPPRYKGATFADYRVDNANKKAVDFAKSLSTEHYSGAFFYGNVGTGKTFLAALIAKAFLDAGKSVLFEKVADLLTEFHAVYRGQGGSEDSLLDDLYNVDLLVLDDFGLEKPTQFTGATLCKILDARYNRPAVTTIITSNYSLEQLEQRLNNPTDLQEGDFCLNGSRIYDRCIEFCKPILFKGESRRR